MQQRIIKVLEFSLVVLLIASAIWFVNQVGIDQLRANVAQFGIWAPFTILLLRLTSIVVPALPGTAYAVLSGALFGFAKGLIVIAIADFLACAINFFIARRYGRGVVRRLVGKRFMNKLDRWSQKYLEGNFFLMTGALMTSFFDYICYAAGLSRMSWKRFISAVGLSIAIVKPPIVAVGAGILEGEKLLIGASVIGVLAIAIITAWIRRKGNQTATLDK
ncbi:VTT domain-containing protein [Leptolyngbya sp. GB1-A1]|uniref:TVP38/TMEM64 family protein n=1 Tax=unclassified Leptolyngbya TaxID=2650499 RepID=UPI0019CAD5AB|nr:TVP38/TMEM64 family protein [Cyanobacteria bacterium FACHB-502]